MGSNIKNLYQNATSKAANERSFGKEKTKNFFKNPLIQFVILGIVFALLQVLRLVGVIPNKYIVVASNVMIYTIVSAGFALLLGYAGLASLGSSCFVGLGAYCTYYCLAQWGVPYIVSILMALAISFIIGLSIGFISLRVQGLFLGIITMGLSEIIRIVLKNIDSNTIFIRSRFLKLFGVAAGNYFYFVIAIIMVLTLVLIYNLMHSPTGRNMLAMKNSTSAAQAFGVNLLKYRVLAFIIACMLASLTGIGYVSIGNSVTAANPSDPAVSLTLSLNVLAAVIIGGYKSLWGTFIGTAFVFGLQPLFYALMPNFANKLSPYISLIIGALMIVIMMFYPGGFYQMFYAAKFRIRGWKQKRRAYLYGAE